MLEYLNNKVREIELIHNSNINEAEETQKTDSTSDTTEEPDYSNMSPEEIEAEIARLLAKRQEEDKKRYRQINMH